MEKPLFVQKPWLSDIEAAWKSAVDESGWHVPAES